METRIRRKIKVAEVITRLDWSGAPEIAQAMCDRLDPGLYDIRLVSGPTLYPTEKTKQFLRRYKEKVTIIPSLKRDIDPVNDVRSFWALYTLFRRERFDIVHTHTAKAGFIGRIAARLAGTPVVLHTPHGHNFYGYFNSLGSKFIVVLEKMAALFADRIVVLTGLEKNDMIKNRVCSASKIDVIPSGIDISKFDSLKVDADKKRAEFNIGPGDLLVGMIGRLEIVKGCEYFIDSAALVLRELPETKFIIVGDGSLRSALIAHSWGLNIYDKVIFTGWREDIPEILYILDVLVLASLNEAVGRIILEAGAVGKPVVATDVGGIPDIIRDDETGILVPPKDPRAMAEAILNLLKDEKKRSRMGSAAKDWIRNNFDENKMIESIHNIYTKAIDI